ncbi:efflux RND transporter periplasmic adaptor subunit [Marimonas lutisalis]|uniref:efflux RND transporter periplasmic adaptor subunit n=1 Tax=Marimonas lutisalis TaxID=2545756 RepID=UPI0010F94F9E|nr:efflux RND transporter periplasmic adaptor subunit [Marimonas lutisalis]
MFRTFFALAVSCLMFSAGRSLAETYDCVITPAVTVRVGSPVSGLLAEVLVDQGDKLRTGQEIARLRSDVEAKTVELLEVQAINTAEIEAQDSRLALAQKRLERAQDLVERNVGTLEQLEASEAEVEVISRERALAEMRREVVALELERARAQLDQRVIRSPLDGIVVTRHLFGGEFMSTEDSVVTIAQIDPLHVEAFLPVAVFRAVHLGMTVRVFPDAPVDGVFDAQIDVIDRIFDAASGTFGIRLTLPNPQASIPAGHRCQLELELAGQ